MIRFLRPKYFFFGILLGFIVCCIGGYLASKSARFYQFERFFDEISPAMQYYPTMHELLLTAKHEVNPDKILVLVGGSSIFRGAGQAPEDVWSKELQKKLGDRFKVLNYGNDAATLAAFGGVAFRVLSERFPKIIFVTACSPGVPGSVDGTDIYSYLFWDAYYKKLYHPDKIELKTINQLKKAQFKTVKGAELHIMSFLDNYFYFRNLWNWVGYHVAFTVWANDSAKTPFKARRLYSDHIDVATHQMKENLATKPSVRDTAAKLCDDYVKTNFTDLLKNNQEVTIRQDVLTTLRNQIDAAYSPRYRSKILSVIPAANPRIIASFSKQGQEAYWLLINHNHSIFEELGYHVLDAGKGFSPDDFVDVTHYSASGGKKMAEQVAEKVKYIAAQNGYS